MDWLAKVDCGLKYGVCFSVVVFREVGTHKPQQLPQEWSEYNCGKLIDIL